jgi:hypothetical protein
LNSAKIRLNNGVAGVSAMPPSGQKKPNSKRKEVRVKDKQKKKRWRKKMKRETE